MSAETGRHVSERVPDYLVRSARSQRTRLGAVLHDPQNHGRHVGHVPAGRQQAGAAGARRDGSLGGRMDGRENVRPHAADPDDRVRRHRGDALPSRGRNGRCQVGNGRRSIPEAQLHQSACAPPRRTARPSRQHPYSAGDRGRATMRDFRRRPVQGRGRLLLSRSELGALVRDWRHQQCRGVARTAAPACRRAEDEPQHRRVLLRLQHAEAGSAALQLASRAGVFRLLRAAAAQSPHWNDPAARGHDAVLSLPDVRRVEDVRIRVPSWLRAAPKVTLNGKALDASAAPGSYLTLQRAWKPGDRVEMDLPMHLHAEAMPDDRQLQAFTYGPLVLAGDLGSDGVTDTHTSGPNLRVGAPNVEQNGSPLDAVNRTPPVPDLEIPTFRARGTDPSAWIKPAGEAHVFRTTGPQKDVTMVPLNTLFDRRYAVYWQVDGGQS